jgi:hypothetical protein
MYHSRGIQDHQKLQRELGYKYDSKRRKTHKKALIRTPYAADQLLLYIQVFEPATDISSSQR